MREVSQLPCRMLSLGRGSFASSIRPRTLSGVALLVLVSGCRSDCDPIQEPVVDQDAAAGDAKVEFVVGTSVATFTLDGYSGGLYLAGGELVFHDETPGCVEWPCQLTIKRLRLSLDPVTIRTNVGDKQLDNLTLSIEAPITLENSGSGYWLPVGTKVHTTVEVDGRKDHGVAELSDVAELQIFMSPPPSVMFDGTLPVVVYLDGAYSSCTQLDGNVYVQANGVTPWAQVPDSTQ